MGGFFLRLGAVRRVKSALYLVNKLDQQFSGFLPPLCHAWSCHPPAMGVGRSDQVLPSRCWLAFEWVRGATLRVVALGFPRWGPVLRNSMDTPGDRQAGTQQLPSTQSSLQAVTFHPSLRQHARESRNILPIPRDGVWGGRKTPEPFLCGEGAAMRLLTEKPGKIKKFPFKWEKVTKLL